MKDLIKEVALEVADKLNSVKQAGLSFTSRDEVIDEYAVKFATAFLAELSKRAEAVAYVTYKGNLLHAADPRVIEHSNPDPLFTFPPIHDIEAIENRVAEACAKFAESRSLKESDDTEEIDMWDMANISIAKAIRSGAWRKYK